MMDPVQLSISKDALLQLLELPYKVKKKVFELVDGFNTRSKDASVHLEPISTFKDPRARTARVGDDYRAIIVQPEKGNHFLLVYVDHHDEAMRWAQNKRFDIHPVSGALQVVDVEEAQSSIPAAAPKKTESGLFKAVGDQELVGLGLPAPLVPSVRSVRTAGDFEKLKKHLPEEAREPLDWIAQGGTAEEARDLVTLQKPDSPVDIGDFGTALQEPNSRRRFVTVRSTQELEELLTKDIGVWRIFLHPDQRKLVNMNANGPVRVLGGPGTGKTVVAMHRAKHLADEVFKGPDDRVLFTAFSKSLALDIADNMRRLCRGDHPRVEITHLHSWAVRYLRGQSVALNIAQDDERAQCWQDALAVSSPGKFAEGFIRQEWDRVIQAQGIVDEQAYLRASRKGRGGPVLRKEDRALLWGVFQSYREALQAKSRVEWVDVVRMARQRLEAAKVQPYRAVVVDETQDLSPEDLKLVRALAPRGANDLFLVGDAHQRIYAPKTSLGACGIDIVGRGKKLKVNYRTTHEIRQFALGLLRGGAADDLDGGTDDLKGYTSLLSGPAPEKHWYKDEGEERAAVLGHIKALLKEASANQVGVLAPTKKQLGALAEALGRAGVPVLKVDDVDGASEATGVQLCTLHRSKGLEFSHVLVVGLGDNRHPRPVPLDLASDEVAVEEHQAHEQALLFVACTRARDTLWMSGFGQAAV